LEPPVRLIHYAEDPLAVAARLLLDHHRGQLPDLSRVHILVPDLQCAAALRRALLERAASLGFSALLGPAVQRLDDWLADRIPPRRPVLGRAAQELVLVEAIRQAPTLFPPADAWLLGDQLLTLFDELTRCTVTVDERLERFSERLQQAYGIDGEPPAAFSNEARILHTLWHAWRRQLDEDNCLDPASACLQRLADDRERADDDSELWLLGFTAFTRAETDWLRTRLQNGRTRLLLHGNAMRQAYHPDAPLAELLASLDTQATAGEGDAFSHALDILFDHQQDTLPARARRAAADHPQDPLRPRLRLFAADSQEQEARAVELQVRRWLTDGHQPVGIVTEDRRLARRVRALLERAGIQIEDAGGWALSTTSAAAVLERWLETIEEDFACGPLLDVLKSAFVTLDDDRDHHLALVRRLEQDIILHENIARGLQHYRHHLQLRAGRLPDWSEQNRRDVERLLNRLDHAADPLRELLDGSHPAGRYTAALADSLKELGVDTTLAADPAGRRVLRELETLHDAAQHNGLAMTWLEFRSWLGRTLERHSFRPPVTHSPVQLVTLAQSRLQRFAALVLAGCTRAQLPGTPAAGSYFNQSVRAELGLDTWRRSLLLKLHDFRRVLEAAPRLLLTRHREQDGEAVAASPWLELLETFHRNAWGNDLHDAELDALLRRTDAVPRIDPRPLPARQTGRPRPVLAPALLPDRWSASSHQRLIDCPYRFFAADSLRLAAQEEIREALEKSDYGEYVHRILQAFHGGVEGLPGPWTGRLDQSQRDRAVALLEDISHTLFGRAVEENFLARGWLRQWLALVPRYIDWQIGREREWTVAGCERTLTRSLAEGIELRGRLDRIDRRGDRLAIVDYKTGGVPALRDVEAGEAVQLPSYALLADDNVERVEYVQFDKKGVTDKVALEGDALPALARAVGKRLQALVAALAAGTPLPAWGDDATCRRCEFSGLCRRDSWCGEEDRHD